MNKLMVIILVIFSSFTWAKTDEQALKHLSEEARTGILQYKMLEKKYYNSADLTGLLSIFTDDINLAFNGNKRLIGQAEVKQFFANFWSQYTVKINSVNYEDVDETIGHVVIWANFNLTLTNKKTGEITQDAGRSLTIYKKGDDGHYRLWREAGLDAGI
ncbi:hypothetical protein AADZ91_13095 [Colwelliaceae bacterium 6441]